MEMKSLNSLLVHELNDLYTTEMQATRALPKMAEAATDGALRQSFESHIRQVENQIGRLRQIFATLGVRPCGQKNDDSEELIARGTSAANKAIDADTRDSVLIGSAQRLEQYEIAGYACACAFAEGLGNDEAARLLHVTLDEKAAADQELIEIAATRMHEPTLAGAGII